MGRWWVAGLVWVAACEMEQSFYDCEAGCSVAPPPAARGCDDALDELVTSDGTTLALYPPSVGCDVPAMLVVHRTGTAAFDVPASFVSWSTFEGLAVWRYDRRGHGASGGPLGSVEQDAHDLRAVLDHIRSLGAPEIEVVAVGDAGQIVVADAVRGIPDISLLTFVDGDARVESHGLLGELVVPKVVGCTWDSEDCWAWAGGVHDTDGTVCEHNDDCAVYSFPNMPAGNTHFEVALGQHSFVRALSDLRAQAR